MGFSLHVHPIYCKFNYLSRVSRSEPLLIIIPQIPKSHITIKRRHILHIPPPNIVLIAPRPDLFDLIFHMPSRGHTEDIIHLLHGRDLSLCSWHEQPDKDEGESI